MQEIVEQIFNIQSEEQFESTALRIFHLQANENPVYKSFLNFLRVDSNHVKTISDIPFLPISFFKTHKVLLNGMHEKLIFRSSGTTGALTSNHLVAEPEVYLKSFLLGFRNAYGNPEDFIILALLPGYLERGDSSLVYMVNHLINETKSDVSGFYLQNHQALYEALGLAAQSGRKILLIGVTHALLKFARNYSFSHENLIVMETGGMKGQGPEYIREEVHEMLRKSFGTPHIHSEYGMTELLSQAYSFGDGIFVPSSTMRIMIRDTHDPRYFLKHGQTGAINVIDLANIYSCSFIETQDLGKLHGVNFEVLGRFDNADVRGCNLMAN